MAVIVDYTFKNVFLTFYILQVGPLKRCGSRGNLPPTLLLDGPGNLNKMVLTSVEWTEIQCVVKGH